MCLFVHYFYNNKEVCYICSCFQEVKCKPEEPLPPSTSVVSDPEPKPPPPSDEPKNVDLDTRLHTYIAYIHLHLCYSPAGGVCANVMY